eukprot:4364152-Amphidinium_carterae.1
MGEAREQQLCNPVQIDGCPSSARSWSKCLGMPSPIPCTLASCIAPAMQLVLRRLPWAKELHESNKNYYILNSFQELLCNQFNKN